MYADTTARGGVLEPEGIVEIKFRTPDLLATMHRLDPVILKLKAVGGQEAAIKAREQLLLPVYRQVSNLVVMCTLRWWLSSSFRHTGDLRAERMHGKVTSTSKLSPL